jgi:excisionase family DNA binding protein
MPETRPTSHATPAPAAEAPHDGMTATTVEELRARPTSPAVKALLIPRQAAQVLAISERTLWQLTHDGVVRCVRIGRAVGYDPRDIQDYIDSIRS